MSTDSLIEGWRARCEAALGRTLAEASAAPRLAEAMRHAALGGGKRLRPLLVHAAGHAFGAAGDALDAPATAVELVHAFSLVHDDLPAMDDDALRRGQPTVHVAWDEATAILAGDALHALGAIGRPMPIAQLPEALAQKAVEGCVIPWEVVPSVKVHELTKFHTEFPASGPALYTTTFVMAMNKAKYESLAPDLKKVIDANSGLATSAWLGKTQQGNDPTGRKAAVDHGNTIHTLSSAEAQEFIKVSQAIDDEWVADMNKRGFDGKKLLQTARDLIAKHSKA